MRQLVFVGALCAAMVFGVVGESMAARLVAHVDISSQNMTVKKDGRTLYRWKDSTARPGKVTLDFHQAHRFTGLVLHSMCHAGWNVCLLPCD